MDKQMQGFVDGTRFMECYLIAKEKINLIEIKIKGGGKLDDLRGDLSSISTSWKRMWEYLAAYDTRQIPKRVLDLPNEIKKQYERLESML